MLVHSDQLGVQVVDATLNLGRTRLLRVARSAGLPAVSKRRMEAARRLLRAPLQVRTLRVCSVELLIQLIG